MPRVAVTWDPIRKEGNATRSELVNKVIKTVKRFEVRREGVQSAARRPIEYEEFINLLEVVRSNHDKDSIKVVRLAKRPRDLFQLWHEYEFGLNGTKPAKEFTRAERGANKFAYSRRKAFWDSVAYLVRAGLTSDVAIDRIYAAYGRQRPVTAILTALRRDKKNGGHPALRV
ncbi:uncharacterized protein IUM83_04870 [Phytophthora cinnamomi]|uniref:uncharacterized protein n=1 Tax=Phytophthora cinnamomi TaxID=4785 RepID=UPI003559F7DD|nr:hypothetical protein IUM83_04871 [Phytophthora cinnamomi]KAG6617102.1 hypothetical protein IUM83_04870 [Phytophthora cinnamomi]